VGKSGVLLPATRLAGVQLRPHVPPPAPSIRNYPFYEIEACPLGVVGAMSFRESRPGCRGNQWVQGCGWASLLLSRTFLCCTCHTATADCRPNSMS
jgi:hypothetical protein